VASDCLDLIGRPYRLGADGSGDEIDCIHLVYTVLERLDIATPPFNPDWYTAPKRFVARDLLGWGRRIARPEYDGDILLLRESNWAFAVTWQTGILYINSYLEKVAWAPPHVFTSPVCFRTKSTCWNSPA
jgi:hypothetical protein